MWLRDWSIRLDCWWKSFCVESLIDSCWSKRSLCSPSIFILDFPIQHFSSSDKKGKVNYHWPTINNLEWKLIIIFRRMHLKLAFLSNDIQIWECDLPVLEVLLEEDLGFIWLLVIIICLVCIRWSEHYNQIRILSIHSSHLFFFLW